jgi:hypothetical protein
VSFHDFIYRTLLTAGVCMALVALVPTNTPNPGAAWFALAALTAAVWVRP